MSRFWGVVSETLYSVYVARVLSFSAVVIFRGVFRVNRVCTLLYRE